MKRLRSVLGTLTACAVMSLTAQEAASSPVEFNANFRLFGEVNRFSNLGFGDMTVSFGVDPSGSSTSGTEIGRIEYVPGSSAPTTTGVLAPLNLPAFGWQAVDFSFSVPFMLELNQGASMFIGLGTDFLGSAAGGSGSKQVIFDFSDNVSWGGTVLGNTLDQGLSLTSVTLADGRTLIEAGLEFEFLPANTVLSAFASAADDQGIIAPQVATALGTEPRAAVFPFGGTANAKLFGGVNRGGAPRTSEIVNLDVSPEPNPLVFDLAGASVGGANNIIVTGTLQETPIPTPATLLLLSPGLFWLARATKAAQHRTSGESDQQTA
jgi:hypothetical protein